ncbi:hypothetical protein Tco_1471143, partial [Tanacetum coccineum]
MALRTQPTLSPGLSARLAKAMALSPSSFRKRYMSSYETPSSSSSPASSPTLPLWKRYRCTSKLTIYTNTKSDELEDEGTDSKTASEGQQQFVLTEDTAEDEPLGLGQTHTSLRIRTTREDPMDGTVYMDIECDIPQ